MWNLRGLKFVREEFAETKANEQTFGEVDSGYTGVSTELLLTAQCRGILVVEFFRPQKLFSPKKKRP